MPGDYLFPKRRFKHGEPLDPEELNEALQPPGERLNGFLGPHNLRAPLDSSVVAKADTFFRTRQVFVDLDPGLSHPNSSPTSTVTDGFTVEQDTSWQMIEADTDGRDMAIDIDTGAATLSLTAFASYCFHGYDGGDRETWETTSLLTIDSNYEDFYNDNGPEVYIKLYLDSPTTADFHYFKIRLPRPGPQETVLTKIAKRVASAGEATVADQADFADPSWAAVGFTARAEGTKVVFTRVASGSSGGGLFYMRYVNALSNAAFVQGTVSTAAAGTVQNLSDLSSVSFSGGTYASLVYFVGQIQFALRVDGVVLAETITGRYDNEQGSFHANRLVNPRANLVGLMVARARERPDALGIPMYTVRLTYDVSVRPGAHRVELVARRAPMGGDRAFQLLSPPVGDRPTDSVMPADNRVTVYSRQLKVLEIPEDSIDTTVFEGTVSVPSFAPEDVVSHESLDDERLRVTINGMNDVRSHQVARGAINGAHLADYSSVLAVGANSFFTGGVALDAAVYPYSYLTAGVQLFGQYYLLYRRTSNWAEVVSADLSEALVAGKPANGGNPCTLSVEGNVFLNKVRTNSAATSQTSTDAEVMHLAAAVFCVGVRSEGTWYLWMPSLAWVNSNLYWASENASTTALDIIAHLSNADAANSGFDYFDVPVTAEFVFNYDNLGLLREIDKVGIFGSSCAMKSTVPNAFANVKLASVNAVAMKS